LEADPVVIIFVENRWIVNLQNADYLLARPTVGRRKDRSSRSNPVRLFLQ
jgi:hypothetical protein